MILTYSLWLIDSVRFFIDYERTLIGYYGHSIDDESALNDDAGILTDLETVITQTKQFRLIFYGFSLIMILICFIVKGFSLIMDGSWLIDNGFSLHFRRTQFDYEGVLADEF